MSSSLTTTSSSSTTSIDPRTDYKRQWQQRARFRKWLVEKAGVSLGAFTADDVDMLHAYYDSLPRVKGRTQTATLQRLLERAERLTDESDYTMSQALQLSQDIELLLRELYAGEVLLTYVLQRGGEEQTVRATLAGPVAALVRRRSSPHASLMQVSFYDLDAQQWRSMHVGDYVRRE